MDSREMFRNAQKIFVNGKINESIDAFTKSIEAGQRTEIAFLSRGVAYLETDLVERALEDFSIVIDMNSQNFRAYFYRGTAYMRIEDFHSALSDYDKTIELKPDYGTAFFARGTAYAQIGNGFEASRNIKTAITLSESSMQGFSDQYGMFRTQFEKAIAFMTGEGMSPTMFLTDNEISTVKNWLKEDK
ncbi:MAG: tetratricopeptide repeat protein [Nitrospirota bacterium]